LTFAPDGRTVLVAPHAYDRAASAWAPLPSPYDALLGDLDPDAAAGFELYAAAWATDGGALALYGESRAPRGIGAGPGPGGPDARLVVADGRTGAREALLLEGERSHPHAALLAAPGFVAAGGDPVGVWERPTGRPLAVLEGLGTLARTLRLSPDGRHLAAGAAGGRVAVWETDGWRQRAAWDAHPDEAAALAFHPGGAALLTGGADGRIVPWTLDGEPAAEGAQLAGRVQGLAFRPDGARLLATQAAPDAAVIAYAVTAAPRG
jgi:hypothetical protein